MYVCVTGDTSDPNGSVAASIYLCVLPGDGKKVKAMWSPFTLGAAIPGG